jgi:hypothetical protein
MDHDWLVGDFSSEAEEARPKGIESDIALEKGALSPIRGRHHCLASAPPVPNLLLLRFIGRGTHCESFS